MPRKEHSTEPSTPLKYDRKVAQHFNHHMMPNLDEKQSIPVENVPDDVKIWFSVFDNEPTQLDKPDSQRFQN